MSGGKRHSSALVNLGVFFLIFFIVIVVNIISSFYFHRFDLTAEKRYSLNPITANFLDTLDEVVFVKVYLEGDFNADFANLRNSTQDLLDEFRTYSHKNIEYQFINPNEDEGEQSKELQRQLYNKGIQPTEINMKTKDGSKTQWIFPGAIVNYKGRETVWQLFRRQTGIDMQTNVNNSVIELEYGLANAIRKLQKKRKPQIAFITGHGELDTNQTQDLATGLSEYYRVAEVNINGRFQALDGVDAIIIAQPDSAFSDKDKYIIDQFVIKGGKALWCIDQVNYFPDSLATRGASLIARNDFNLTDYFFKHGIRFNDDMVQDLQCGMIKLNAGVRGGRPEFKLYPWMYKALVIPTEQDTHRIVKNLEYVKLEYAGTIDTAISAPGIKKTVLLKTSRYTHLQFPGSPINFNTVRLKPNPKAFKSPYKPVAVLLEGQFKSIFTNHIPARIDSLTRFKPYCDKPNKMIVISDGDILRNNVAPQSKGFYPLGFDRDMQTTFANKTFMLNCVNHLLDDDGIMAIRSKNVKLRLLNKKVLEEQSGFWSFINMAIPLLFVVIMALIQFVWRRIKYKK